MKLSYDPRYNIAYLKLREKSSKVQTIKVSEELNVDMAPDGTIYGIELLNANRQLPEMTGGKLVIENEATGARAEVALP
jgi:uncharacterized protein YuzE